MSSTPAPESPRDDPAVPVTAAPDPPPSPSMTESVLDSLGTWTVIAAAVALLYLVWVTLEILDKYVGDLPKVGA
jgi:hypothetical protein